MKAKELRIGNYFKPDSFYRKEFDFEIVTPNHLMDFATDPQDDYYKPIPLTEEWLVKFGFAMYPRQAYDLYTKESEGVLFTIKGGDRFYYSKFEIKYAHQLQNIYFALTGEELEYVQ